MKLIRGTVYIQYVDDHHLKRLEQNDEDKPSRAEPSRKKSGIPSLG